MVEAHLRGVRNALEAGWRVLQAGGRALEAVEEAVVVMEDDETFDAGRGSFLNREGRVQMDALIMDGATLRAGGVGCVERLRNPVRAARKILSESPHVYFVGEGAEQFAAEHGVELCKNEDLVITREVERFARVSARKRRSTNPLQDQRRDRLEVRRKTGMTYSRRRFRTTRLAPSRWTARAIPLQRRPPEGR